jgi:hypothetical protein
MAAAVCGRNDYSSRPPAITRKPHGKTASVPRDWFHPAANERRMWFLLPVGSQTLMFLRADRRQACNRQTLPCAFAALFGSEERVKDLALDIFRNPAPGVGNRGDDGVSSVTVRTRITPFSSLPLFFRASPIACAAFTSRLRNT